MAKGHRLLAGAVLCTIAQSAFADLGFEVRGSTLGLGAEVNYGYSPHWSVGVGYNGFTYSTDTDAGNINYDVDLELSSVSVLGNYHPWGGIFRFTGGVLINNNELSMTGTPSGGTFDIGDQTYTAANVGQLNGLVSFHNWAPYLGVGWGKQYGSRFGLSADLGVAYQGSAAVDLSATGPIAGDPAFQNDLRREEQQTEDDLSVYKYYPVLGLGVYFRF